MNILLISDLFIQICEHVENINQLLNFGMISSKHIDIIKKTRFINLQIKISDNLAMKYIETNYHFANLRLISGIKFNINYLKKCHTLDLYKTQITNQTINSLRKYGCIINK